MIPIGIFFTEQYSRISFNSGNKVIELRSFSYVFWKESAKSSEILKNPNSLIICLQRKIRSSSIEICLLVYFGKAISDQYLNRL